MKEYYMTQSFKLELLDVMYSIKEMQGLDGCSTYNDERLETLEQKLLDAVEKCTRYRYYHEEVSTDVRSWTVESDVPMNEDQVAHLCSEHGFDETIAHDTKEGNSVQYRGTDYGDDSQVKTMTLKGGDDG